MILLIFVTIANSDQNLHKEVERLSSPMFYIIAVSERILTNLFTACERLISAVSVTTIVRIYDCKTDIQGDPRCL